MVSKVILIIFDFNDGQSMDLYRIYDLMISDFRTNLFQPKHPRRDLIQYPSTNALPHNVLEGLLIAVAEGTKGLLVQIVSHSITPASLASATLVVSIFLQQS
jgi:hypothetical protein